MFYTSNWLLATFICAGFMKPSIPFA